MVLDSSLRHLDSSLRHLDSSLRHLDSGLRHLDSSLWQLQDKFYVTQHRIGASRGKLMSKVTKDGLDKIERKNSIQYDNYSMSIGCQWVIIYVV